jgi:outer membrane protein, multidrug efflux system
MKRILLFLNLLLSGCLVGPHYRPPAPEMPTYFSEDRTLESDDGVDANLAEWWTHFHDPFLDDLLTESLHCNYDLLIALERVCQARANYWIQFTGLLPDVEGNAEAARSRASQSIAGTVTTLSISPIQSFYQAGMDAIWQIDLFGGLRRAARAAYNTWEASCEDARAVRIVVLSEVAIFYTQICGLQQEVDIALQTVELDQELLQLALVRFEAGLSDEQEVAAAEATLQIDQATATNLETSLQQAIYSLAILLGRPPETLLEPFATLRPIPYASGKIPVGLPSDLLRRRPDIRSAERQIAAATEEIGVAVANLFPQISLTGSSSSFSANPLQGANVGFTSNALHKLLRAPSRIWGIGGLLSLPLFDFGKRMAMVDTQLFIEHQALLAYEKTVIGALQEVESDLVAYFNEEIKLQKFDQQLEADRRILELTLDLYQAGLADYTQVLQAKQAWLLALDNVTTSQQALTTDLIALYKALGGGWECCYTQSKC